MLFNYLFFFYLLYGSLAAITSVPVFLLDNDNVLPDPMAPVNPLASVPQPDFMELVQQVRKLSSCFIIFVENEFCTEDISTKDKLGSPFYILHKGFTEQKVRYFPSISQPYELLNQIFPPRAKNVFYLKEGKTATLPIYDNRFKYFYVFFEDNVNESRIDALRRHDSIINEVFQLVKQFYVGPVSALYTGRTNPMMPKLRHVPFSTKSDPETARFVTDYTMITLSGVHLLKAGLRWPLTDKIRKSDEWIHENMPMVGFDITNFRLNFVFVIENKGWLLWRIRWREQNVLVGTKVTNLRAPWNVSFACNVPIHIINERDGSILTISNYQIELVPEWLEDKAIRRASKIRRQFLRSVNCQPFFSAPIVTVLFLTFICLGILFFGVLMMMDCNANDRYDDPQGKPLTISETLH